MLKNAKELRKQYQADVKKVADTVIANIQFIEAINGWENFLDDDLQLDLFDFAREALEAGNDLPNFEIDVEEVYNYLTCVVDPEISKTLTVIEALEEVFEVDEFLVITLKGLED